MTASSFRIPGGGQVPAVTAAEMRAVDRVAVEDVGLQLLQMMENAGRALAWHAREVRDEEGPVVVIAGNGGNGGGGLVGARHLSNRDIPVHIVVDRPPEDLTGAAAHQHRIIDEMALPITTDIDDCSRLGRPSVIVDAFIGYGLRGEVRPPSGRYIDFVNQRSSPTVSLDVPSGIDATTGEPRGAAVRPDRTVTLALPKTGLDAVPGALYLADIGIPAVVYDRLDIDYVSPFGSADWVELRPKGAR